MSEDTLIVLSIAGLLLCGACAAIGYLVAALRYERTHPPMMYSETVAASSGQAASIGWLSPTGGGVSVNPASGVVAAGVVLRDEPMGYNSPGTWVDSAGELCEVRVEHDDPCALAAEGHALAVMTNSHYPGVSTGFLMCRVCCGIAHDPGVPEVDPTRDFAAQVAAASGHAVDAAIVEEPAP